MPLEPSIKESLLTRPDVAFDCTGSNAASSPPELGARGKQPVLMNALIGRFR